MGQADGEDFGTSRSLETCFLVGGYQIFPTIFTDKDLFVRIAFDIQVGRVLRGGVIAGGAGESRKRPFMAAP